MPLPRNAFTVDVEDFFHVSAFAATVRPEQWDTFESRVEGNTRRLLELLEERDARGTFFVLGWVAERNPALVREIHTRGHEVACHGYSHQLVYEQGPERFRDETLRAKKFLEDTIGEAVHGYRAASYSITRRSLWALEILNDAGFAYDSSIFPIKHDRYGIASAPRLPFRIALGSSASIAEFPLTTFKWSGLNVPVAGGGYFRLLPYTVTRFGFRRVLRDDASPVVFYMHPWEIDTGQPRLEGSFLSRFRHYTNIDRCEARVAALLSDFKWGTMRDALATMALPALPVAALAA
jgi:polysaccharide deacetylase family protein (PEP-CTERM system associated)